MMSEHERLSGKQLIVLVGAFIGILSLCWLIATLPSSIAQQRFDDGVAAIAAGDCAAGIEIMLQASDTLLLPQDKGEEYARRSERYSSMCDDYLVGVRAHENEQYVDALLAYHEFASTHGALGLFDLLRDEFEAQVILLLEDVSHDELVNADVCAILQYQDLLNVGFSDDTPPYIVPFLPSLHGECVQLELAGNNETAATAHYTILTGDYPDSEFIAAAAETFVQYHYDDMIRAAEEDDPITIIARLSAMNADFPDHPVTQQANDEAPQLIVVNDGFCLRLRNRTLFINTYGFDLRLSAFDDYIPSLHLACIQNELVRENFNSAQTHYARLQDDYPDNDAIAAAGEVLAQGYYDAMRQAAEENDPINILDWLTNLNDEFPDLAITQQANEEAPILLVAAARMVVINLEDYESPIAAIDGAITALNYVREHYDDHPLADAAETLLARALVAQADLFAAAEIVRPLGDFGADPDTSILSIANSTPHRLRIALVGPEERVEILEPCRTCRVYVGEDPDGCPSSYTEGIYTLIPGDYNIVVSVIEDRGITPFRGNWALEGGFTYAHCFFVVRDFR